MANLYRHAAVECMWGWITMGYKVGKMRQSHIVEALSVHSGAGLKLVGSDLMVDLKRHLVGMKRKGPM